MRKTHSLAANVIFRRSGPRFRCWGPKKPSLRLTFSYFTVPRRFQEIGLTVQGPPSRTPLPTTRTPTVRRRRERSFTIEYGLGRDTLAASLPLGLMIWRGYGLSCWGFGSGDFVMIGSFVDVSFLCVDRRFEWSAGSCGFVDDD